VKKPALSLTALILIAFGTPAAAEPKVAPMGVQIRSFDGPEDKYRLMSGGEPGASFAGGLMNWFYNDANRPAGVTKAAALAQIQSSMAKWHAVCNITFNYQGETNAPFSLQTGTFDGTNVIGWAAPGSISAPTTGMTNIGWDGANHIIDAEIRLNGDYGVTYTSGFDATLTHEVGHALGLDHSDISGQVMSGPPLTAYDGATTLGSDDIAGCVHLYGGSGGGGPAPDTQAPTVPTGLAASSITTSSLTLTWNASTDNVGVTGYKIYANGSLLGTVASAGASVTGLSPGTTYGFTVSACDAANNCSAQTAPLSATTVSLDIQAPTTPAGLVATPASTSQINLAWNASTDNVGVTGYPVYQGGVLLGSVASPSASVTGLAAGTAYTFTVAACDAAGNCSPQSAPASANTQSAMPTCSGPQPPDEQQTLACPAGQTGAITQTRSHSCVGTTWTPGAFQTITNTCTASTPPPAPPYYTDGNYEDLWWGGAAESGWGLTITQHGDALFLAWYIYDSAGKPVWVVLPTGRWDAAHTTYSGSLYIPSGSSFAAYDATRFVANAPVGTASIRFDSATSATLTYTVRGISGSKTITREPFGAVNTAPITHYGDMWWGGTSQDGWGLVLAQQYHDFFGAWYTYDATGQTMWYVMPTGVWTSSNTYSGALFRTRGGPVLGTAFNTSAVVPTQVGTLTVTFTDANTATMTYTVDGVTQSKPITRIPF
jgi:chitodextrinase